MIFESNLRGRRQDITRRESNLTVEAGEQRNQSFNVLGVSEKQNFFSSPYPVKIPSKRKNGGKCM